jgi:hypothetical protein
LISYNEYWKRRNNRNTDYWTDLGEEVDLLNLYHNKILDEVNLNFPKEALSRKEPIYKESSVPTPSVAIPAAI